MKNIIMAAVMATVMGVGSAHAQGLYIGVGGEYVKSTAHNVDATAAASLRAGVDINKYIASKAMHDEIVDVCQAVLKELNSRTFQLRDFISWERFIQGV